MQIQSAFLANYAEQHEGLLCVLGGWPEFWGVPEVPSEQRLTLVTVAEVAPEELGRQLTVDLTLRHAGHAERVGALVLRRDTTPLDVPDGPRYVSAVLALVMTFQDVGPWEIALSDESGTELASVRFVVRLAS